MSKLLTKAEKDTKVEATAGCDAEIHRAPEHLDSNVLDCPRNSVQVRVVREVHRTHTICDLLVVDKTNQGEDLATKLREAADKGGSCLARGLEVCKGVALMQHYSIWIVLIVLLSRSTRDLEDQSIAQRVYVMQGECSDLLTHAFHDPQQLRVAPNFVLEHLVHSIGGYPLGGSAPQQALYIRKVFSKKSALIWVLLALALSAATGTSAGIVLRDIDVGFAIGGGALAVMMALQCVVVWQVKS